MSINKEAKEAREYISTFHLKVKCPPITYVDTNHGRINFDTMTDEEAIRVMEMMQDMEREAGKPDGVPSQ